VSNAYLVDIKRTYEENKPNLIEVDISPQTLKSLEKDLEQDLKGLREFIFTPKSSLGSCLGCDVNSICGFAKIEGSK